MKDQENRIKWQFEMYPSAIKSVFINLHETISTHSQEKEPITSVF